MKKRMLAWFLVWALLLGIIGPREVMLADNELPFVPFEVPATSVKFDKEEVSIAENGKIQLNITVLPQNHTDKIVWSSSNEQIATVSSTGLVKAGDKSGTVTITVKVGKCSATCKVVVVELVQKITFTKSTDQIIVGDKFKFEASVAPSTAANKKLVWSTSDTNLASVDANGVVTALKPGTVTITAEATDGSGKKAECKVKIPYEITYQMNGGKNHSDNPKYYLNEAITLQKPTKDCYAFAGWYKDAKYTEEIKQIKKTDFGNLTLYAKWKVIEYKIVYNGNGQTSGAMSESTNCEYGATYTLKANRFKKTGYKFAGWNTQNNGSGKSYGNKAKVKNLTNEDGKNITLYAQWTPNKYKIVYKGNGQTSGKMSETKNCKYGSNITLKSNAFKKKGYTFAGWNTKANGKGKRYSNKANVKNLTSTDGKTITLYAQWKKVKYTITYKLNKGTNNKKNPASYYVTTSTITLKNPKRTGYVFKGWYSDSSFKKKVTKIKKGSTGNIKLYAKWEKVKK